MTPTPGLDIFVSDVTPNPRLDIFFYEAFKEEATALQRYLPATVQAGFSWKTIQEQGDTAPPAPLISIRTQSVTPAGWSKALAGILARTTGYDQLLTYRARTASMVPCGYLPLYCNRAVAEHALLMWLALLRKLPRQIQHFAQFNRDGLTGGECLGKNLLCVGVGNIGSEILKLAGQLGMDARGVDVLQRHPSVTYVSPEDGIAWADIIVCAMNLTKENVGYFDYETLQRAKPGVIFINIARGEMSPAADLLRLLDENHLGGLALDVFDEESSLAVALRTGQSVVNAGHQSILALARKSNVILTPHNAFNTVEAVERKAGQTIQQLEHFLKNRTFLWPVP